MVGLELALYTRLILNLWQFAQLCLSSARLTDLCRSAELQNQSSAVVVIIVEAQINYHVTHSHFSSFLSKQQFNLPTLLRTEIFWSSLTFLFLDIHSLHGQILLDLPSICTVS